MRVFLVCLGLCFALSGAMAADSVGFDPVYKGCFQSRNWGTTHVTIAPASKYATHWYDVPLTGLVKGLMAITNSVDHGFTWIGAKFGANNRALNATGQFDLLASYIKRESAKLPQDEWTEFRKGCMVLCASANYLKYEQWLSTKFGSVHRTVESKHGVCTEFAHFADRLASRVGIPSHRVMNTKAGHAYVKFYMPSRKKWYYAEPQDSSCRYMDPAQ
jgi:hypothetical protein